MTFVDATPSGRRAERLRHRRLALAITSATLVLVGFALLLLLLVTCVPAIGDSAPGRAVLSVSIVDGPVPFVVGALAALAVAPLLIRRWHRAVAVITAGAGSLGAAVAVTLLWLANAQDWFGVGLDTGTWAWSIATFAVVAVLVAFAVTGRAWQRMLAGAAVILVAISGTLGVNADFGIQRTLADFAGVSVSDPVRLPPAAVASPSASATATPLAGGALWANWRAPASLPNAGTTGTVDIPGTVSGFHARAAGRYLPPAALAPNPPALPLMIFMMGQPGLPDPSWVANSLNAYASRHDGLAPIVVVADQLGNPAVDTLCLDTDRYGKVQTYITQDVLPWARTHLHVLQDAAHTVVGGYSNGGECAIAFGAKFPDLWSNVLDISGEAYPGSDRAQQTLSADFHGDAAAYRATWPATILAAGRYPDSFGVVTVGSNDPFYRTQAMEITADAKAAGWQTDYAEVPNGGHVAGALRGGLDDGFAVLYGRLGLSQPGTSP